MVRKCAPGMLCIENYTLLFFTFLLFVILYFMYIKYTKNLTLNSNTYTNNYDANSSNRNYNSYITPFLGNGYSNKENDVLLNPYSAPMRDDRIYNNSNYSGPKIAINIPTQSINTNYRQIGILTRVN